MTFDDIRGRLDKIKASVGDFEAAHGLEDDLYVAFIFYVSSDPSDDDLGEKAKLVLTSEEIDFPRYCA